MRRAKFCGFVEEWDGKSWGMFVSLGGRVDWEESWEPALAQLIHKWWVTAAAARGI